MPSRRIRSAVGRACAARHAGHVRSGDRRLAVDIVGRAPGLGAWLASIAPARARGEMTVAIVSDARVRALNRKFRKKNAYTDVLSFPADEPGYLGDVVISGGV